MPYVNGTLYSLLGNPKIAETAKNMNLAKKLEAVDNNDNAEAKMQIGYVLKMYEESGSSTGSTVSTTGSDFTENTSSDGDDGFEEDEESIVHNSNYSYPNYQLITQLH